MAEELGEAFRIVPDQNFITNYDSRRRLAFVLLRQFSSDRKAGVDAALLEFHAALGQEILDPCAWRTILLRENDYLRLRHLLCQGRFAVLGSQDAVHGIGRAFLRLVEVPHLQLAEQSQCN